MLLDCLRNCARDRPFEQVGPAVGGNDNAYHEVLGEPVFKDKKGGAKNCVLYDISARSDFRIVAEKTFVKR